MSFYKIHIISFSAYPFSFEHSQIPASAILHRQVRKHLASIVALMNGLMETRWAHLRRRTRAEMNFKMTTWRINIACRLDDGASSSPTSYLKLLSLYYPAQTTDLLFGSYFSILMPEPIAPRSFLEWCRYCRRHLNLPFFLSSLMKVDTIHFELLTHSSHNNYNNYIQ